MTNPLRDNECGQTIVESAFVLLMVIILVFGVIEFSSAVYTYTVLADAANEGVRAAIVNSANAVITGTTAVNKYIAYSLHNTGVITVTVTCNGGSTCPTNPPSTGHVVVDISYPYVPYLAIVMQSPPTMHAHAEGWTVY